MRMFEIKLLGINILLNKDISHAAKKTNVFLDIEKVEIVTHPQNNLT